ncbi:M20 family metallopeptidase [Acidimangrovimonas sediminis]|uniref:M20 family metallopeptidase n=1 Tax=Acidimangrovimonas sediminis TaxID=2056283 RepID=UPI000C809714|nr:M20/M25/M40 family metallo-hydrolase [Acidimangrovimonas sediminis]
MSPDYAALVEGMRRLTLDWCAIPSHAGNPEALARQAEALRHWLVTELGATIVTMEGEAGAPPVIHARLDLGAARTVVLYNMYDVMPATDAGWTRPPFTGGEAALPGIARALVARGAENNKGPMAGMLVVLKALRDAGQLRCNVEILLDGQEETGSGGLRAYLARPDCPLRPAAAALFPSFCEYGGGPVRMYLGFSGIARGHVVARHGDWGGPANPIHSSNAPWIANPASRLVAALSRFGQNPTGEIGTIAFPSDAATILSDLARGFDPAAELRFRNTRRFTLEGDAETLLRHVLTTATATLSSLSTDPPDAEGVIPTAARARFALRTPPGLDPRALLDDYAMDLKAEGLEGVTIAVDDAYPGHRFPPTAPGVAELRHAYEIAPAAPQIWPWAIGAAPAYAFAPHAESFLIAGLGRGGNAHGPDEFLDLDTCERFLASLGRWLIAMGA